LVANLDHRSTVALRPRKQVEPVDSRLSQPRKHSRNVPVVRYVDNRPGELCRKHGRGWRGQDAGQLGGEKGIQFRFIANLHAVDLTRGNTHTVSLQLSTVCNGVEAKESLIRLLVDRLRGGRSRRVDLYRLTLTVGPGELQVLMVITRQHGWDIEHISKGPIGHVQT